MPVNLKRNQFYVIIHSWPLNNHAVLSTSTTHPYFRFSTPFLPTGKINATASLGTSQPHESFSYINGLTEEFLKVVGRNGEFLSNRRVVRVGTTALMIRRKESMTKFSYPSSVGWGSIPIGLVHVPLVALTITYVWTGNEKVPDLSILRRVSAIRQASPKIC